MNSMELNTISSASRKSKLNALRNMHLKVIGITSSYIKSRPNTSCGQEKGVAMNIKVCIASIVGVGVVSKGKSVRCEV